MSFCCGASMIGTKGTLKHYRTHIHNVPILFCPVCHRVEIHHSIENEYEILAEYAHGDGASEIDFQDYVDKEDKGIFENCVNNENEDPMDVVTSQIDMALDLLIFAKQLNDQAWQDELKKRLGVLNGRRNKLRQRRTSEGYC
ncbi:hypothetical protein ABEV74_16240 [Paenibacillus cisolokensis]|jgi:hypothetical protein|uniref:YgiT-type zinc finger domain-containing protein n=1 Tax=Paenibacillus cisolokensis TaxID=1658519 RepID=A0ABQ4NDJ8_9BACL|nr:MULTISPECIES: hypothetical protein [Paenibacillus]ALS29397.1 membrane protein [Paenibacillus sp. 32O-W]GIQ66279.1 hypothetical protein PACILC2_48470 [Paenibacillus cisolokensis]